MAPGTTDTGIHYIMDNLVAPILQEFEPVVLINSAGQDNHYSDPLANMRLTAQGYGLLNRKLRPDIAVLEGGYSVETALPYINMAIIMAMAGIDFSNVREPDYTPGRFTESPRNMDDIKALVKRQLAVFRARRGPVERLRAKGRTIETTSRNIFYDTDSLHEQQRKDVRICPECCGFRTIASSAVQKSGSRYTVFCISLPGACCGVCAEEARLSFEEAKDRVGFDYIYLQDRIKDEFRTFDSENGEETVL
jgi:hypothetical protein